MGDRRETFERELSPEPGRTAPVVVDMQRGFLDPGAPLLVGRLHPEHQPANPGAPRGFGLPSSSCLAGTPSAAPAT